MGEIDPFFDENYETDFVVNSKPLSEEEADELSEFFYYEEKRKLKRNS